MKFSKANYNAVCRNLANVLRKNEKKRKQMETVQSICTHLTSDDGISIDVELYDGNIARYLIQGTRCSMTVTYNTLTNEIVRKPRNLKPWYTDWLHGHCNDILNRV